MNKTKEPASNGIMNVLAASGRYKTVIKLSIDQKIHAPYNI